VPDRRYRFRWGEVVEKTGGLGFLYTILGYDNWLFKVFLVDFFVELFAKNIWGSLSSSHKIMVQWKMGGVSLI